MRTNFDQLLPPDPPMRMLCNDCGGDFDINDLTEVTYDIYVCKVCEGRRKAGINNQDEDYDDIATDDIDDKDFNHQEWWEERGRLGSAPAEDKDDVSDDELYD